jgi:hypothetical protein
VCQRERGQLDAHRPRQGRRPAGVVVAASHFWLSRRYDTHRQCTTVLKQCRTTKPARNGDNEVRTAETQTAVANCNGFMCLLHVFDAACAHY